jgi:hypothetical protein
MKQTLLAILFTIATLIQFSAGNAAIDGPQPTKVTVYPNPATNYISIDNSDNVKEITIINLVGRKLKTFENVQKDERYDVSELPNGMYLVQIVDNSNKVITTVRVSKR